MIFDEDNMLEPYKRVIERRYQSFAIKRQEIAGYGGRITDKINNHNYFILHLEGGEWVFRDCLPNATAVRLIGDFNNWTKSEEYRFKNIGHGTWELRLPKDKIRHMDLYKWYVEWPGGEGERLPAYATRCIQDPITKLFAAQVWMPAKEYGWKSGFDRPNPNPLIYEAHIGMSSEDEKVSNFNDFRENVLPRIAYLGYNTLQLMALQEHPYYGSFGYQVSNFFALSSRFGTPEEFKELVDEAHALGIAVVMDIVHSHAVDNTHEGLSMIDGRDDLYFHSGERGRHPAWESRLFDYGKDTTLFFLLSNCKFWLEEYHLDGFRFDGVTSMIYYDHGLGRNFTSYEQYYDGNQDVDALVYLGLANSLIHEINPNAITIAEEMSGMPGLVYPLDKGGWGFDFRLSMGVPDNWIKWIKERRDEEWNMEEIFFELTNRRKEEKCISYVESHDQAMVGDKTVIFRLIDKDMYTGMSKNSENLIVERGIALHKMIRLVTISTAGDGYLNFMGNEFGHPEWIDFPREGNNFSYFYARRQWSLSDNRELRYNSLLLFDRDMIRLMKDEYILSERLRMLNLDNNNKIIVFARGDLVFVFNFNPEKSFKDYRFSTHSGRYIVVLDTDKAIYDGIDRNDDNVAHFTIRECEKDQLSLYLPSRTAIVLKRID